MIKNRLQILIFFLVIFVLAYLVGSCIKYYIEVYNDPNKNELENKKSSLAGQNAINKQKYDKNNSNNKKESRLNKPDDYDPVTDENVYAKPFEDNNLCEGSNPFTDYYIYSRWPYLEYQTERPWRRFDHIRY